MRPWPTLGNGLVAALLGMNMSAAPVSGSAFRNDLGLAFGGAFFSSGRENRTPGNALLQGSAWMDRIFHANISLGVLADFTATLCPICDDTPDDDLYTLSVVGGTRWEFRAFRFQAGAGIGAAKGNFGVYVTDGRTGGRLAPQATETFHAVNVPLLARALLKHDFRSFGIGSGMEIKYHLNSENRAMCVTLPVIVSF